MVERRKEARISRGHLSNDGDHENGVGSSGGGLADDGDGYHDNNGYPGHEVDDGSQSKKKPPPVQLPPLNISDPEAEWVWNRRFKVSELFAYPGDCDDPLAQQHKRFLHSSSHSSRTTVLLIPPPPPPPPVLLREFTDVCSVTKFALAPIRDRSKTFYWSQTFVATDQGNHFGRSSDKCGQGNPLEKCFQDSGLAYLHYHTVRYPKWSQKVYSRAVQSYDMDVESSSSCEGMHGYHYCKYVRRFIGLKGKELFLDYVKLFCNQDEKDLVVVEGLNQRFCPKERVDNP